MLTRILIPTAILVIWLVPALVKGQQTKGIKFVTAESWKQVLEKAKSENKNIFLDAYATWCGPCKKMDAEVYTDPNVGDSLNKDFIAIKVQFDKTNVDSDPIRKWYTDANYLLNYYNIEVFPTFLFISPDGELILKYIGYQSVDEFLKLIKDAKDPQNSYSSKIEKFNEGQVNGQELLHLSLQAKDYHHDSVAKEIALQYKRNVIDKSKPSAIITPTLATYIMHFHSLLSNQDSLIQFMYKHKEVADSLFKIKGYSQKVSDNMIAIDIINPILKHDEKKVNASPDWNALERRIARSYDATTAKRLLINAKIDWYSSAKDWQNIIKYNIEKLDHQGLDTSLMGAVSLNNLSYNLIFQHSNDSYALNKAIGYMELLLKNNPTNDFWLDTYANLLYKVGRKKDAIKNEEAALSIAKEQKSDNVSVYEDTLKKMQDNIPTWQ